MVHRFAVVILLFPAVALGQSRTSQITVLSLAGTKLIESLTDRPQVVGNLLVGVNWETPSVIFVPDQITIELPLDDGKVQEVCLAVATQDGRYNSRNLFHIPPEAGPNASFDYKTREQPVLAQYITSRIGVIVRTATSCDAPNPGPIFPVSLNSASNRRTGLVTKINADPKDLAVQLGRPGGPSLKGQRCEPAPEGTAVAFRAQCTIPIVDTLPAGTYTLTIEIKELFRSDKTSFKIQIR